ncbi:MAG: phosphatidylinositol-specific phospholipase C/glycerophosphodiester phosphodiesterase family protein [Acidobacteriota bacterium]
MLGRSRTHLFLLSVSIFAWSIWAAGQTVSSGSRWLAQAHSHNDYQHPRPLLDALERGFCSVEADVFLVNGQLLVAHDADQIRPERTLESLYLEPLAARLRKKAGPASVPACLFTLLIDVKSEAEPAWKALSSVLQRYRDILTVFDGDEVRPGLLTVFISGNRAASLMLSERIRYAGLDGRLSDVDLGLKPAVMPLLSDDWTRYFEWSGKGGILPKERDQLNYMVKKAHAHGYRVRFWAAPDNPAGWAVLKDAGVDFINTDDLEGLSRFLRQGDADE